MTALRPMSHEAYPAFFEDAIATYAAENVAGGRWLAADAPELARAETLRLLGQGVDTPDHHLFEVLASPEGSPVGYIWFAAAPRGSIKIAFVFQIKIQPPFQRQGHARAALELVEQEAVRLGLAGMALHVFACNPTAQALYRSLGYEVSSLNMIKPFAHHVA